LGVGGWGYMGSGRWALGVDGLWALGVGRWGSMDFGRWALDASGEGDGGRWRATARWGHKHRGLPRPRRQQSPLELERSTVEVQVDWDPEVCGESATVSGHYCEHPTPKKCRRR
jgi:hypothetical protein